LSRDGFERVFDLQAGEEALVGRSLDAKLFLLHPTVSRNHCKIRATRSGFEVVDLGSRNECSVNGRRVAQRAILTEGAVLKVGNLAFCVARLDAPEARCSSCGARVADADLAVTADQLVVCPACLPKFEDGESRQLRDALAKEGMTVLAELSKVPPTFRVDRRGKQLVVQAISVPGADLDGVSALRDEVRALAWLEHEAVTTVVDVLESGELLLLCSKEPRGESLLTRVERDGPIPTSNGIAIAARIVDAVAYANASGVVHRDIVPANVFVEGASRSSLANFAIARDFSRLSSLTRSFHAAEDTERLIFLAPELVAGGAAIDVRADVFGVGAILLFALTGRSPWGLGTSIAAHIAKLVQTGGSPRLDLEGVPREVASVLSRLMAPAPAARVADAAEAKRLIDGLAKLAPP
jgi:serine/threonine-protein kinase